MYHTVILRNVFFSSYPPEIGKYKNKKLSKKYSLRMVLVLKIRKPTKFTEEVEFEYYVL
jgi:hypothetical protein